MNAKLIILSKQDQEVLVSALLNPPDPNEKLRAVAKAYKRKWGTSNFWCQHELQMLLQYAFS
jgi:uncharacterized protein (DUF1778 family)